MAFTDSSYSSISPITMAAMAKPVMLDSKCSSQDDFRQRPALRASHQHFSRQRASHVTYPIWMRMCFTFSTILAPQRPPVHLGSCLLVLLSRPPSALEARRYESFHSCLEQRSMSVHADIDTQHVRSLLLDRVSTRLLFFTSTSCFATPATDISTARMRTC